MAVQSMLGTEPIDPLVAAEEAVRNYCGWHVAPVVEQTIRCKPATAGVIYLPTLKLVELVGLTVSGEQLTAEQLDAVEWSEDGMLRRPGGWPSRWGSVVATIRHGYDDASDAAVLIRDVAERQQIITNGIIGVAVGNRQSRFAAEAGRLHLTPSQKDLLDKYRIAEVLR